VENRFPFGDRTERWSPTLAIVGGALLFVAALAWLLGGAPAGESPRFLPLAQAAAALGAIALLVAVALRPSLWMHYVGVRQVRYGLNTLIMVLAFLAIILLINYVAKQPAFAEQWDLTEEQELTLHDATRELVTGLAEPVQVLGFYTADQRSQQDSAESLLKQYRDIAPDKFNYTFVDPLSPGATALVGAFGIQDLGDLGLYIVQGERRQKVDVADESSLTTAIYRLLTTEHTVYFLQGHGELTPEQTARSAAQALGSLGYVVRTTPITSTTVPTDTSLLVVARPLVSLAQREVDALRDYLAGGGAVLLLVDPAPIIEAELTAQGAEPQPFDGPLTDYLRSSWAITLTEDLVIDRVNSLPELGGLSTLLSSYPLHQITNGIELPTLLMFSRSIQIGALPSGVSVEPFLETATASQPDAIYGETDYASLRDQANPPTYDPATDRPAPLTLGVAGTVAVPDSQRFGRLVVVGSSSLIAETLPVGAQGGFTAQGAGNRSIWLAAIDWLVSDDENPNAPAPPVIPASTTTRQLDPTKATVGASYWVAFSSVCLIPGLVVLAGIVVFIRRRR
jgi:ABC-type uncharacterized transport system involved in gliding motility auxiliary subunit